MICPHCLETIDDGSYVCPKCGGYTGAGSHSDFIFCEGCGARLSPHDRTCPKCGRPAPGILSTSASASDLAAGKTASFPKLTSEMIETERAQASAQSVLSDSLDPSATNILNTGTAPQEDPFHRKRKVPRGIIAAVVTVLVIGAAAFCVVEDPFGVMPGFYSWLREAASEAFPSRQIAESAQDDEGDANATDEGADTTDGESVLSDAELGDDEAFTRLNGLYERIIAFTDEDQLGMVIDDFNGAYLLADKSVREDTASGAYALRDRVQAVIDELEGLKLTSSSVYEEDREHLIQLATWMYERVDVICQSWDISLAVPEGESMTAHQTEILQPLREAGSSARESFDANVSSWRPRQK